MTSIIMQSKQALNVYIHLERTNAIRSKEYIQPSKHSQEFFFGVQALLTNSQLQAEHQMVCKQYIKSVKNLQIQLTKGTINQEQYKTKLEVIALGFISKNADLDRDCSEDQFENAVNETRNVTVYQAKDLQLDSNKIMDLTVIDIKQHGSKIFEAFNSQASVNAFMVNGKNFRKITLEEFQTFMDLTKILKTAGPILIQGYLGKINYQAPAEKTKEVHFTQPIYEWSEDQEKSFKEIAIVPAIVIGARFTGEVVKIYWIDPLQPSSETPKVYSNSFIKILSSIVTNTFKLPLTIKENRDQTCVGYVNPELKFS